MAKNKIDMNKNFENLKAQMLKKRELAETVKNEADNINATSNKPSSIKENTINTSESETINTINSGDENVNVDKNVNTNLSSNISSSNSNNICESISSLNDSHIQDVIEDTVIPADIPAQQSIQSPTEYVARKSGTVSDININKIVIKKVEKQEQPKRITYYLKPETIKKIDKFSKLSGMGKSEFVQKILDEVLNNLEIER